MKDETWFSALEAQSAGLCDDVVTTPRKEELSNLSVPELLSRINNEYQSSNKKTNMKEIAKALGLPEGASQQQILDDIAEKRRRQTKRGRSLSDNCSLWVKRTGQ